MPFQILHDGPSQLLKSGKKRGTYVCLCSCGVTFTSLKCNLKNGRTRSCGCVRRSNSSVLGKARRTLSCTDDEVMKRTRTSFVSMHGRCKHKGNASYPRYGALGITVCERWATFPAFYADMGIRPSKLHTVDRIDNTKGYSPENCRWATRAEQSANRACSVWITFQGRTLIASEWARILNHAVSTILRRNIANKNPDGTLKC